MPGVRRTCRGYYLRPGDMTEVDFMRSITRKVSWEVTTFLVVHPFWACSCGCKRFRKVNPDGTDAPVKVKLFKNIRKAPADKINWETSMVERALQGNMHESIHHYKVVIETELGEKELLSITAVSGSDAEV